MSEFKGSFSYGIGTSASNAQSIGGKKGSVSSTVDNNGNTTNSAGFGFYKFDVVQEPTGRVTASGGVQIDTVAKLSLGIQASVKLNASIGVDTDGNQVVKVGGKFEGAANMNSQGPSAGGPVAFIGGSIEARNPVIISLPANPREPFEDISIITPSGPVASKWPNSNYNPIDDPFGPFGPARQFPSELKNPEFSPGQVALVKQLVDRGVLIHDALKTVREIENGSDPFNSPNPADNPHHPLNNPSSTPGPTYPAWPGGHGTQDPTNGIRPSGNSGTDRPPSSIGTEAGTKGKGGSTPSGVDPAIHGSTYDPLTGQIRPSANTETKGGQGSNGGNSHNDGVGNSNSGSGTNVTQPRDPSGDRPTTPARPATPTGGNSHGTQDPTNGVRPTTPTKPTTPAKPAGGNGNAGNGGPGSNPGFGYPVLLDLDNDEIEITELSRSTTFMDADGDGLAQRTAWAGAGDGVLFFDVGNDGQITEAREYIFTEWDPTATSDLKALRAAFDTNGDGKLTAADADFSKFKVMVTNADGTQEAKTLTELGITEINLTADATLVTLADGSQITGTALFKRADGSTGTLADAVLVAEAEGYRVEKTASQVSGGPIILTIKAYDATGNLAYSITNTTSVDGLNITNNYDDNGDGVTDRIQTITTVINADGSRSETLLNQQGNTAASAITQNRTVTTTSADGKSVTIQRDSSGGGWFDEVETRVKSADGSHANATSTYAQNGTTLLAKVTETIHFTGTIRDEYVDSDGVGGWESRNRTVISKAGGLLTTTHTTYNKNGTLRHVEKEVIATNGQDKVISRDRDGNGVWETVEELDVTVNADTTRTNVLTVKNADGSIRGSTSYTQSADTLVGIARNDNCLAMVLAA